MPQARTVAVIGGGWAGLAAAVEATRIGHQVTLFEMAAQLGGRAREVRFDAEALDNGQHILIGAYTETLALMQRLGVDVQAVFVRTPLRITYTDGSGLQLNPGRPVPAFVMAVLRQRAWSWPARLALLGAAASWSLRGFRCPEAASVADLTSSLSATVRHELIDPLCVAALNTPPGRADANVFLRVLRDALFSGPGSADLLLPRVSLSRLLPEPAEHWLVAHGAVVRRAHRVERLQVHNAGWRVDDEAFDHVVLAAAPLESARLAQSIAPDWSRSTAALNHEPIVTVYLRSQHATLPAPMLALRANERMPAQFAFDRGQLGGSPGLLAFVISGAQRWVEQGSEATLQATLAQMHSELGIYLRGPLQPVRLFSEKRATFTCTPALERPVMRVAPGLHAAGDHVTGPYPATLESAVRSGLAAVRAF